MVTRRQLWALVALTFMWGINWPMMKLSLREVTPLYFRAITMTGGTLGGTLIVGEWPHWHDCLAIVSVMAAIAAVPLPTRKPA